MNKQKKYISIGVFLFAIMFFSSMSNACEGYGKYGANSWGSYLSNDYQDTVLYKPKRVGSGLIATGDSKLVFGEYSISFTESKNEYSLNMFINNEKIFSVNVSIITNGLETNEKIGDFISWFNFTENFDVYHNKLSIEVIEGKIPRIRLSYILNTEYIIQFNKNGDLEVVGSHTVFNYNNIAVYVNKVGVINGTQLLLNNTIEFSLIVVPHEINNIFSGDLFNKIIGSLFLNLNATANNLDILYGYDTEKHNITVDISSVSQRSFEIDLTNVQDSGYLIMLINHGFWKNILSNSGYYFEISKGNTKTLFNETAIENIENQYGYNVTYNKRYTALLLHVPSSKYLHITFNVGEKQISGKNNRNTNNMNSTNESKSGDINDIKRLMWMGVWIVGGLILIVATYYFLKKKINKKKEGGYYYREIEI